MAALSDPKNVLTAAPAHTLHSFSDSSRIKEQPPIKNNSNNNKSTKTFVFFVFVSFGKNKSTIA